MSKVKIKLVSIGHLPLGFDPKKIKNFSSSLFEVIEKIDNHELRCNSDGFDWEFSDHLVREQMPKLNGADFMIAIVNVPLEDNWYSRRLGGNQVIFTFYEIKEILQSANIPLENVIYRLLNAYTFAYKRNNHKIPEFHEMTDFTHDETRGCIFDMNGIKSDLVASCHNPIICSECKEKLRRDRVSNDDIESAEKDIKKIRKDLYFRILDKVKRHPISALSLSSLFAFLLGVAGSITGSYLFEYLNSAESEPRDITSGSIGQPAATVEKTPTQQTAN
ncbi:MULTISPECIES: hypothetical protein [unclassified Oleiphilus]|uniref:hypothetical protein n=2 Tax=Oleiphilus TaxID=141450 RepID=UPI000838B99A|nr:MULTISPECIES: hypothetical protein [unclassified Oleiphilus]